MLVGRRRQPALVGDAVEAVVASVHSDWGFYAGQDMVLRLWGDRIGAVDEDARDAKTALQEWAQARGMQPPSYVEVSRDGPDHAPHFTISAQLANGQAAEAKAGSKRQAEQAAAKALLAAVEQGSP